MYFKIIPRELPNHTAFLCYDGQASQSESDASQTRRCEHDSWRWRVAFEKETGLCTRRGRSGLASCHHRPSLRQHKYSKTHWVNGFIRGKSCGFYSPCQRMLSLQCHLTEWPENVLKLILKLTRGPQNHQINHLMYDTTHLRGLRYN